MQFSVTEVQQYMRCRRQASLASKNGQYLTPIFSGLALSVGSIVHRAMQLWLESPATDLCDLGLQASVEAEDQAVKSYLAAVGAMPGSTELLTLRESIETALAMLENYQLKYSTPLPPEYTLYAPEQRISAPVPYTEHNLNGRLDALILHMPSGRYDILEHKTYSIQPKQQDLQFNFQFLAYIWLVKQLDLGPPDEIPRIAYDGLWRRSSVPRGKTLDDLFARYILIRPPHELQEFENFLPQLITEMAFVYSNPDTAYPNRRWDGCWDCGVSKICDAMSRGEDHQSVIQNFYTKRTDKNEPESESA